MSSDLLVIFDIQHVGLAKSPDARGAAADLDGDGKIELHEREAELTPLYAAAAARKLYLRHGVPSLIEPTTLGTYAERHERAKSIATVHPRLTVVYLACHLNAGGGDYAASFHLPGQLRAAGLAHELRHELLRLGVARSLVLEARPDSWTSRVHHCLSGLVDAPPNLHSLLLEPCFMDTPEHRHILTPAGLLDLGDAVARAIGAWHHGA